MSIADDFYVQTVPNELIVEWLTKKHYQKRAPAIITHAFAMYETETKIMVGACTYSLPARGFNDGYGVFGKDTNFSIPTYELSRLIVNEGLPRNALSFFVAQTFGHFPKPVCLVSYADSNFGHHGYIYQATNWVYCGMVKSSQIFVNKNTGEPIHRRTLSDIMGAEGVHLDRLPDWIELRHEEGGKHRYFQFLGSKADRKKMLAKLAYPIEPYPKGDNARYDASYSPASQIPLF